MSLVLIAALSLAVTQQASDAPSARDQARPEPAAVQRDPELDREVCRRERVLGSNRPERICMTVREWNALRDQSREDLNRTDRPVGEALPYATGGPSG